MLYSLDLNIELKIQVFVVVVNTNKYTLTLGVTLGDINDINFFRGKKRIVRDAGSIKLIEKIYYFFRFLFCFFQF